MTKAKLPPRSQPPSSRPPPPAFPAPRAPSPPSTQSPSQAPSSLAGHPHEALVADAAAVAAAAAAAKKKKKKGKAKKTDDGLESLPPLHPHGYGQSPSGPFTATAQAQADLLSTASELYRRMEADPQGIPDDDAYWTSLPAHLRTFIRNALPLGQLPASAQAVASTNDANSRQASTQAMIAVAQQLAQAAHASQRHLQQHPPGPNSHPSSAFSSVPFDPSVFADLALHPEQALPLHPHPNSSPNSPHAHHNSHNTITATNNSHLHHHHHHHLHRHQAHDDDLENALYSSAAAVPNPPPTRPPGEPLPAPVVLVNEYGEERGEFEDDYYSDEELDAHEAASLDGTRDGLGPLSNGANGLVAPPSGGGGGGGGGGGEQTSTKKKNKKKKKKSGATDLAAAPPPPPPPPPLAPLLSPQSLANPKATIQNNAPTSNVNALHPASNNNHRTTSTAPPAPSSRAAGKQPMTFSSTAAGKAPAGGRHPTSANGIGHGHGHGHGHGAVAAATGGLGKRTASVAAAGHPGGPASVNGVVTGGVDRTQQQQQQQQQQQPQQAPKVWSSSSAEEREKIKEFWLCLNDKERRSLLKVEKEAVLRRMKEQQKHLCSCRVCGRKRHAIEDELDVLYEAYYVELEQYASHQQQYAHSGGTIPPPPGPGPFPGSVALDSTGAVIGGNSLSRSSATARGATQTRGAGQPQPLAPTGKKVTSLPPDDDEGYDDEDLEDDEYEDDYDDEEDEEDDEDLDEPETKASSGRRRPANATSKAHSSGDSFFNLGSSLTVKGGSSTLLHLSSPLPLFPLPMNIA
ncbi:hypothetical protein FA10DRAFT_193809 [Acaromyces ingoldii]|uniref:Stress response protein NST1 n=1 Tax=Acaromyces ingoldii TaxID=215250 RepID=A0A316YC59_9BASI|nr:hypothetical protein FA10DRAFT_193809 [Acaromyces ingoldii]PWN87077.1 hypothetical protein FA10DRAFT_193809 [Acaromyces ingoldii]